MSKNELKYIATETVIDFQRQQDIISKGCKFNINVVFESRIDGNLETWVEVSGGGRLTMKTFKEFSREIKLNKV